MANKIVKNNVEVHGKNFSLNTNVANNIIGSTEDTAYTQLINQLDNYVTVDSLYKYMVPFSDNAITNSAASKAIQKIIDSLEGSEPNSIISISVNDIPLTIDSNKKVNIDLSHLENSITIISEADYKKLSKIAKKDRLFLIVSKDLPKTSIIPTSYLVNLMSTDKTYPTAKAVYQSISNFQIKYFTQNETYSMVQFDNILLLMDKLTKEEVSAVPVRTAAKRNTLYLLNKGSYYQIWMYIGANVSLIGTFGDNNFSDYVEQEQGKKLSEVNITPQMVANWNSKSDFSGKYSDLTNIPSTFSVGNGAPYDEIASWTLGERIIGERTFNGAHYYVYQQTIMLKDFDSVPAGSDLWTIKLDNDIKILLSFKIHFPAYAQALTNHFISDGMFGLNEEDYNQQFAWYDSYNNHIVYTFQGFAYEEIIWGRHAEYQDVVNGRLTNITDHWEPRYGYLIYGPGLQDITKSFATEQEYLDYITELSEDSSMRDSGLTANYLSASLGKTATKKLLYCKLIPFDTCTTSQSTRFKRLPTENDINFWKNNGACVKITYLKEV